MYVRDRKDLQSLRTSAFSMLKVKVIFEILRLSDHRNHYLIFFILSSISAFSAQISNNLENAQ